MQTGAPSYAIGAPHPSRLAPRTLPEPAVDAGAIKALTQVRAPRLVHAALRCQPPDPVLAHDPPDLRDVDATRHVGRQAEARSVVAIQIQALRNRGESGTVLRHRPRKVEIVGPNRVEALVHPPDREAHRTAPAEQVLDGRCGAEVLEG